MAHGVQLKPTDAGNSSFHVTIHGIGDLKVFGSRRLKAEMLERLRNHLSRRPTHNPSRRPHEKLFDVVSVLAYCVMDNHLHLVVHQKSADGMRALMQRALASFARMFNDELRRRGAVFDGRYAAVPIGEEDGGRQLKAAIAYVLLNDPVQQLDNPDCSHSILAGDRTSDWLDRDAVLAIFGGWDEYRRYMNWRGPKIVREKLIEWGLDPDSHPYRPI